jgi:hypothetical protein
LTNGICGLITLRSCENPTIKAQKKGYLFQIAQVAALEVEVKANRKEYILPHVPASFEHSEVYSALNLMFARLFQTLVLIALKPSLNCG